MSKWHYESDGGPTNKNEPWVHYLTNGEGDRIELGTTISRKNRAVRKEARRQLALLNPPGCVYEGV